MTKYLRVKETYCGCISVQYFAILASCVTLAAQLTFAIFFLIYGQLWGLIPLFLTIASHLFFMITISQFQSTICMTIYTMIEIAFSFTILGFAIWILSWILDPESSFIYHFCVYKQKYSGCYGKTQLDSFIWGVLFAILFFVSVILLPIYRNTVRNIKATRKSSSVYIDDKDNNQSPAVQPIFNINAAQPQQPPQQIVSQILRPQQLQGVINGSMQPMQQIQQQPIQQQPMYNLPSTPTMQPQASSIMTPMGTIQLNLYTIQLPNGNTAFLPQPTPVIEQMSSNFSDSVSQACQTHILERL